MQVLYSKKKVIYFKMSEAKETEGFVRLKRNSSWNGVETLWDAAAESEQSCDKQFQRGQVK